MRIIGITSVLLVGTLANCGGEKTEKNESPEKEKGKPYVITYTDEINNLFSLCDSTGWPYAVDTTLLDSVNKFDSIGGSDVARLYVNVDTNDITTAVEYEIKEFFGIDSLKQAGKYAEWASQRDIGQMKYANAYILHKIHVNDTTDIITWAVTYGTYEACPYASGSIVFATTFYKGTASNCTVVGEDMAAGDPPVGMTRLITSDIMRQGNINVKFLETDTDVSDEGESHDEKRRSFSWKIVQGKRVNSAH